MSPTELAAFYHGYIACLNARDWFSLGRFVHPNARHNGEPLGLGGYQAMLERDCREIPDLGFTIALLAADPPLIASRLDFDCHPAAAFLGIPVNGQRVRFSENVFYRIEDERIADVWSLLDKAAIERQLA